MRCGLRNFGPLRAAERARLELSRALSFRSHSRTSLFIPQCAAGRGSAVRSGPNLYTPHSPLHRRQLDNLEPVSPQHIHRFHQP